jgi:DNA-binding MarR family transcriptional regulator
VATRVSAREAADRLHSAAIHLLRHVRKQDKAAGIGPARLSALSVLAFGGPMSLTELAALEQVTKATMSRVVDGLVRARLVTRAADPADRRAQRLRATPRGARLMREARRRRVAYLAKALRGLGARERRLLAQAAAVMERLAGQR